MPELQVKFQVLSHRLYKNDIRLVFDMMHAFYTHQIVEYKVKSMVPTFAECFSVFQYITTVQIKFDQ